MKKSLLAVAALAASGAALAQSSVTLFGVIDATLALGRGSVSNKTQLTNSGNTTTRLGFRGTEDLGGGLAAGFWLEAGLNNDDGTGAASNANNQTVGAYNPATGANAPVRSGTQGLTFNRRSTVSLSGGFGEIRVGRDYTPHFWNYVWFDPFTYNGVGASQIANNLGGATNVRASNSVSYFLPANLGGFYGQLQHYRGENSSGTPTAGDGTGTSLRVGYASGAVNAALATSQTRYASGNISTTNLGASYDFGPAKLSAIIDQDRVSGGPTGKGWLIGVNAPMGVGEWRASYSTYKGTLAVAAARSSKLSLGYVHNLSKRTALYVTLARLDNKDGGSMALNGAVTGANSNSTGYDFGLRHSF
jgi:predicted porin